LGTVSKVMETWAFIWKVVFIGVLSVFAGMSVWVTVGGWADVRKLLQRLSDGTGVDSKSDDAG